MKYKILLLRLRVNLIGSGCLHNEPKYLACFEQIFIKSGKTLISYTNFRNLARKKVKLRLYSTSLITTARYLIQDHPTQIGFFETSWINNMDVRSICLAHLYACEH